MLIALRVVLAASPSKQTGGALARFLEQHRHSERMKMLGPFTMGIGIFIFICANAILHENRDRETKVKLISGARGIKGIIDPKLKSHPLTTNLCRELVYMLLELAIRTRANMNALHMNLRHDFVKRYVSSVETGQTDVAIFKHRNVFLLFPLNHFPPPLYFPISSLF